MKKQDYAKALLVVAIWGANFTVMKLGLTDMPSMLLAALRFLLVFGAGVWFVKRPRVPWGYVAVYGLTMGGGQFACLFYAVKIGMPAGLSSVVLQSQAAFTALFAALLLREKIRLNQLAGVAVAAVGLVLIGSSAAAGAGFPVRAFVFTILAAAFWAASNVVLKLATRRAEAAGERLDVTGMVVWSALAPPLPLLAMALLMDTPETLLSAMAHINGQTVFALCYLAFGATMLGYGLWGRLLAVYPATRVAPLSLLVPVSGLLTARAVLGEQLTAAQWVGGAVILAGLAVSNLNIGAKPQAAEEPADAAGKQ